MNPDAVSGSGELLGRVIDAIVTAHLAAEPVVNGKLVGAENAGAVEPAEHQWRDLLLLLTQSANISG